MKYINLSGVFYREGGAKSSRNQYTPCGQNFIAVFNAKL
jgi:hypothetical protein